MWGIVHIGSQQALALALSHLPLPVDLSAPIRCESKAIRRPSGDGRGQVRLS
jgi:hypothetical protein